MFLITPTVLHFGNLTHLCFEEESLPDLIRAALNGLEPVISGGLNAQLR